MSKMAEVAKLLGVELYEEFEVEDYFCGENNKSTCRLTEDGLQSRVRVITCIGGDVVERWERNNTMLGNLICGDDRFNIVKKPWTPKDGEAYYSYFGNNFKVGLSHWSGFPDEFAKYKCGMAFRTKEEAVAARPRVYKELTGKEWSNTT